MTNSIEGTLKVGFWGHIKGSARSLLKAEKGLMVLAIQ
jgi:hypothetical protein